MHSILPIGQAVGHVLAHDVTRIVPGQSKGPAFRKGHIIREQDIETLLDMGKQHVYVLELSSDEVHEDSAARRIAVAASGPGVRRSADHSLFAPVAHSVFHRHENCLKTLMHIFTVSETC